jgi:hypothetical protein
MCRGARLVHQASADFCRDKSALARQKQRLSIGSARSKHFVARNALSSKNDRKATENAPRPGSSFPQAYLEGSPMRGRPTETAPGYYSTHGKDGKLRYW